MKVQAAAAPVIRGPARHQRKTVNLPKSSTRQRAASIDQGGATLGRRRPSHRRRRRTGQVLGLPAEPVFAFRRQVFELMGHLDAQAVELRRSACRTRSGRDGASWRFRCRQSMSSSTSDSGKSPSARPGLDQLASRRHLQADPQVASDDVHDLRLAAMAVEQDSLRIPARWTLSPISVQTRIRVSSDSDRVPGKPDAHRICRRHHRQIQADRSSGVWGTARPTIPQFIALSPRPADGTMLLHGADRNHGNVRSPSSPAKSFVVGSSQ